MKYIFTIALTLFFTTFAIANHVSQCKSPQMVAWFGTEIDPILDAAKRNNLPEELLPILFAIRKAENGASGREFGIMDKRADTFEKQAGWCAATIRKNYERWSSLSSEERTNRPFITFLANRYCPIGADNDPKGLNKNWEKNVNKWIEKIKVEIQ